MLPTLHLNRIDAVVKTAIETGAPVVLFGAPGVGKTAALMESAARARVGSVLLNATSVMAFDLIGMPIAQKGKSAFADPTWLVDIDATGCERGILVLDELGSAPPEVMPAFAQLLGERRCGPHRLPVGWAVIATSNRPGDRSLARPLPAHIVNRAACWLIEPHVPSWVAWAQRQPPGTVAPELIAFVGSPDFEPFLSMMKPGEPNAPWLSFRSLTLAVQDLVAWNRVTNGEDGIPFGTEATDMLVARIPMEVAHAFLDFALFGQQLPRWEDILASPDTAVVPEVPKAGLIAVEFVVARALGCTTEQADLAAPALARWLKRCPGSVTAAVVSRLLEKQRECIIDKQLPRRPFLDHPQFARLYPKLMTEVAGLV